MQPPPSRWFRLLLLAYPSAFRRRYRQQLERALLTTLAREGRRAPRWTRLRLSVDLLGGALLEWIERLAPLRPSPDRIGIMIDQLLTAMRATLRRLLRSPAFSLMVVLTITLGIGANTAIFALVDGVLLEPMPYEDPDELYFLWSGLDWIDVPRAWIAGPHVPLLRERADLFEDLAAIQVGGTGLGDDTDRPAQRVTVAFVSTNLFRLLGVEPMLGRGLLPAEEGPDGPAVVLLGHDLWKTRFAADPEIVGRDVTLDGTQFQVVGVMPESFRFAVHSSLGSPSTPEVYRPVAVELANQSEGRFAWALLGRLAEGAEPAQARAQLDSIAAEVGERAWGRPEFRWRMVPLHPDLVKDVRPALIMLLVAVGLVLAIVCSNLATLFLGRALDAQREVAVRSALGAGSWSRLSTILLEGYLLTLVGGVLGVALGIAAISGLLALAPSEIPRATEIGVDWSVVAFTLLLVLTVGTATALVPAWRQRRVDVAATLREGGRSASGAGLGPQTGLVVAQVALSAILLVAAGLIGRSLVGLFTIDPGFRTDGVLTATVRVPTFVRTDDAAAVAALARIRDTVSARRDVASAGWTNAAPLSAATTQSVYSFAGTPGAAVADDARLLVDRMIASAGYYEAIGMELLEGRGISDDDGPDGEPVAVIDELLARRYWPEGGAVGSTIANVDLDVQLRVVGVVRHSRLYDIRADDRPQIWHAYSQLNDRSMTLAVHAPGNPAAMVAAVRDAARRTDPRITVDGVRTSADIVGRALSSWLFLLRLLGVFGVGSLILAGLGVYGVVALSVAQRSREIGIRIALGARPAMVGRAIVARALRLTAAGLGLALVCAIGLGRLLASFLFGIGAFDLPSLAGVAVAVLAVALVAAAIPALRAVRVSPAEACQSD